MNTLHEMATKFAKEMIEHNLNCGATSLDLEFIAEQACELTYLIDRRILSYEGYKPEQPRVTAQEVDELLGKHLKAAHGLMHTYRPQV